MLAEGGSAGRGDSTVCSLEGVGASWLQVDLLCLVYCLENPEERQPTGTHRRGPADVHEVGVSVADDIIRSRGTRKMLCALQDDGAGVRDRDRDVAATFKRSSASSALRSRFSVLQSWIRLLPAIVVIPSTSLIGSATWGQTASCSVRDRMATRSLRTPSASCVEEPTTGLRLTATEAQGRGATSTTGLHQGKGSCQSDGCRHLGRETDRRQCGRDHELGKNRQPGCQLCGSVRRCSKRPQRGTTQ